MINQVIETQKYFFFVMEYAEEGELSDYIEGKSRLCEEEAAKFFKQLILAVQYLHKQGCAHRDIKPSNILIDWQYNIKLIDFGLGNLYSSTEEEKLLTACGSPCYAAPEIISGEKYDPVAVDIWSSGVTLYAMLCGYLPFDEESKSILYERILACKYAIPKYISDSSVDLLKKLLVRDPRKRLSIEEILEHPWLKKYAGELDRRELTSPLLRYNLEIGKLTANKLHIEETSVKFMIEKNEHNEYTTLYYLLLKKKMRGDIELQKELDDLARDELEIIKHKIDQISVRHKNKSVNKSLSRCSSGSKKSKLKPLGETTLIRKHPLSGISSKLSKKEHPKLNLKDISVEIQESIIVKTNKSSKSPRKKKTRSKSRSKSKSASKFSRKASMLRGPKINM